jgi:hypothetical protein
VVVCEPGEDHHLISDEKDPCVNIYLHADDTPHPKQEPNRVVDRQRLTMNRNTIC